MKIKKGLKKEYENYVKINSEDEYSHAVILAGEAVGKALDEGKTPEEADNAMNGLGLTGFMAGCVAQAIAQFHPRGKEFRVWWNKQWGVEDEKEEGVVNPAILTIDTSKKTN